MKCLLYCALFLLPLQSFAQDNLGEIYSLTEDVRDIVVRLPDDKLSEGVNFELTPEEADRMKALAGLDQALVDNMKQVGEECVEEEIKEKIQKRDFKIDAFVIASDKKFEQESMRKLTHDYFDVNSLINSFKEKNGSVSFDGLDLKKREALLAKFSKDQGMTIAPGIIMKELAINEMVEKTDNWKSILKDAKDKLTSDQKIALVSRLGGLFSDRYDYSRSTKSDGKFISSEALLQSVKNGNPGGVCRDIALAQIQYLEELGFKQNYVVAYKDNGAQHATVISFDPVSKKIVKFNYSDTTTMEEGAGTEALNQDHNLPERGLSYRLYDTSGKSVAKVPTELSQVLKEATGGESDRVFNQKNYSVSSVGFTKNGITGNLFTGRTSAGEEIYGAAIHREVIPSEHEKYNMGVSVSKLKGDRSKVSVDQTNLYLLARMELTTSALKTGSSETRVFGAIESETLISKTKEVRKDTGVVKERNKDLDASVDLTLGVKNKYASASGKTIVESEVSTTMYPDYKHVATANGFVPTTNQVLVRSKVSSELTDDKRALVDAALVIKKYGTSAAVKAALVDEKRQVTYRAGASVPLSKDVPTFLPGGEKRLSAGLEKAHKNFVLVIELERNLTNKSNAVSVKGEGKF